MKKLISLILALILLVSAIPAFAASSLTPEKLIGTWDISKIILDGVSYGTKQISGKQYYLFNADGTGSFVIKSPSLNRTEKFKWSIDGNTVITDCNGAQILLELKGSSLVYINSVGDLSHYYRKAKDTTGKTVTKAILSSGIYKLNNSSKTAVFVRPSPFTKCTSLKIPDTIKVQGKTYKVVEIASKACKGNLLLTTVTIGKNIKTIGANAFNGCKALRKITFTGTSLSKVKASAFDGIRSKATVTCPKAKLSKYQKLLKKAGIPANTKFKAK